MTDTSGWSAPGGTPPPDPGVPAPTSPPGAPPSAWGPHPAGGQPPHGQPLQYAGWQPGPAAWQAPKPGVIPLRPLQVGDLLDGAITLVRTHWRVVLGMAAVVVTVTQLIQLGAQLLLVRDLGAIAKVGETATGEEFASAVGGSTVLTLLAAILSAVGTVVLSGLVTSVVGRAVLGEHVAAGQAWRDVRPRLPRLLGASLLAALSWVLPFVAAAVPGTAALIAGAPGWLAGVLFVVFMLAAVPAAIYLYVAFSLAPPALVLERIGAIASLWRSRALVRRSWWRVCGILLLAALLVSVIGGVLGLPFTVVGAGSLLFGGDPASGLTTAGYVATTFGGIVSRTLTTPFSATLLALLYVDLRIRREAFDLELARAAASW